MSMRHDGTADGRGQPSAQDTRTSTGEDPARHAAQRPRALHLQDDPQRTLAEIAQTTVALDPGFDDGSISIVLCPPVRALCSRPR